MSATGQRPGRGVQSAGWPVFRQGPFPPLSAPSPDGQEWHNFHALPKDL